MLVQTVVVYIRCFLKSVLSIQVDKKNRATVNSGQTCLWDSGATDSMIKRKHTEPY